MNSSELRLSLLLVALALLIVLFVKTYPIAVAADQSPISICGSLTNGFIRLRNCIDLLGSERLHVCLLATAHFTEGSAIMRVV